MNDNNIAVRAFAATSIFIYIFVIIILIDICYLICEEQFKSVLQKINQLPQIIDILLDLILTMKLNDLITCLDSILM